MKVARLSLLKELEREVEKMKVEYTGLEGQKEHNKALSDILELIQKKHE